jgi:hypothetical protein
VSTTRKEGAAPRLRCSVITEYEPAETLPDGEAWLASLVYRAESFFVASGHIPESTATDEQRLAALVATYLMSATVALARSALDEAQGTYGPTGAPPTIR